MDDLLYLPDRDSFEWAIGSFPEYSERFDLISAYSGTEKEYVVYEDHLIRCEWEHALDWPYHIQRPYLLRSAGQRFAIGVRSHLMLRELADLASRLRKTCPQGKSLNETHANWPTLLDTAIDLRFTGAIKLLKQCGAKPRNALPLKQAYSGNLRKLMGMCRRGDMGALQDILTDSDERLLRGGDPQKFLYELGLGLTEALIHRHLELAKHIFEKAVPPEPAESMICIGEPNYSWRLHQLIDREASCRKQMDAQGVAFWLNLGEDINELDLFCRTPLDVAIESGHEQAVQYLRHRGAKSFLEILTSFRLNKTKSDDLESLSKSVYYPSLVEASQPLNEEQRAAKPFSLTLPNRFLEACVQANPEQAREELEAGIDLTYAHHALDLALQSQCLEAVRLILHNGLHVSILRPHLLKLLTGQYEHLPFADTFMELIVSCGCAVNFFVMQANSVFTPLDYAVASENTQWIRLLKQSGAKTYDEILDLNV